MNKKRNWAPFLLILPSVVYLAVFFAWPMFRAMTLAVWDDAATLQLHQEASSTSPAAGSLPQGAPVAVLDRQGNLLAPEAVNEEAQAVGSIALRLASDVTPTKAAMDVPTASMGFVPRSTSST